MEQKIVNLMSTHPRCFFSIKGIARYIGEQNLREVSKTTRKLTQDGRLKCAGRGSAQHSYMYIWRN